MRELVVGMKIKAIANGNLETFRITKIGRKYVYLISDQYSSDGKWFGFKKEFSETHQPKVSRL